jgi:hypothetical protein
MITRFLFICLYSIISIFSLAQIALPSLIPYRDAANKWGYCNAQKKIIIPCQYEDARPFANGVAWVLSQKKWGLINAQGKFLFEPQSDEFTVPELFTGPLAVIRINNQFGFINRSGKIVIPPQYSNCWGSDIKEGLIAVKKSQWGFIDLTGKEIIPLQFEDARPFSEGLAPVKKNGKWGFIDKKGQWAVQPQFDLAKEFSGGLAPVQLGDNWGYINKSGKAVVEIKYQWTEPLEQGIGRVKQNDKYALMDKTGKFITGFDFEFIYPVRNNHVVVRTPDFKYGLMDIRGQWVIPDEHDDLGNLQEGLLPAAKNEVWGYINLKNQWVVPPQFQFAEVFKNGLARVKMQLKNYTYTYGYIDKQGNKYWDAANDRVVK